MGNKEMKLARLKNTEGIALTETQYNLTIGLVLVWGFLINTLMARFLTFYIIRVDYRAILIAYLVSSLACVTLVFKARKPAVSFLGFTGLAVAMGLILTYFLTFYDGHLVYSAFLLTGIITVGMMILSTLVPNVFLSIGKSLGVALLFCIVVELIGGVLMRLPMSMMDYGVVLLFSLYIGYDWAKAQMYPRTLNNALSSAADIYIDIINIFIRILSIMGKKKN